MKRITVYAYEVALVMKEGELIKVLGPGKHWIGFGKEVKNYSTTEPITLVSNQLQLMAKSPLLSDYLTVVSIEENELGFQMKDGKYERLLTPRMVGYWNSPIKYTVNKVNLNQVEVSEDVPKYILGKVEVLSHLKVYPVESYQKGLLYIDGKFVKTLEPGLYTYWKSMKLAVVKTVDMRIQTMDVAGQELLTKDKAGIRINFTAQYQVIDEVKALNEVKEYEKQLYSSIQLSLREYIGTMTLDQLLASKEAVGPFILNALKTTGKQLGVQLISSGIKDIILPGDVKSIMNQVLIAQKKAQANTIMRQEETASTRSLLNTAKLMEQNTMLMKLKEMEYMEKISEKIGEITVNGGSAVFDQLREMVVSK